MAAHRDDERLARQRRQQETDERQTRQQEHLESQQRAADEQTAAVQEQIKSLDEVLTSEPTRADLRRLLAKVALEPEVGQLQTARKQLEVLLPEKEAAWPEGKAPPEGRSCTSATPSRATPPGGPPREPG